MKLGIDIGASKILGISFEKKILKEKEIPTPKTKREFLEKLSFFIKELSQGKKIEKIGISICGLVKEDEIVKVPNLSYLEKIPLKKFLKAKFKTKIKIENDLNCFLIAEKKLGKLKKAKNALLLGLGSGLGGAILIEGKIYKGSFGQAGEFGHCVFKLAFPLLLSVEDLLSEKWFKKKGKDSKDLFEKAKKGDPKAKKIFQQYGKNLGILIGNLVNIFDPEIILLCGGISLASRFFLKETKKTAKKIIISPIAKKNLKISLARFKRKGAALGALFL